MKKIVFLGLGLLMGATATAAPAKMNFESLYVPEFEARMPGDAELMSLRKSWVDAKRKVASQQTFSEADLSADFKKLRDAWLGAKTADEVEALLQQSHQKWNEYSDDTKYFLSTMHLALPLRGIVWRLRPLVEQGQGFLGSKPSHVFAVEMLRTLSSELQTFFPTSQTEAGLDYFTTPSKKMTLAMQFKNMAQFQEFLASEFARSLTESAKRTETILKKNPAAVFVWDNRMAYGDASFGDGLNRFVGHGPAEMNMQVAGMYRALSGVLVFCAYNQDALLEVGTKLAGKRGWDATALGGSSPGLTDRERLEVIKKAAQSKRFLELRNYGGTKYGSQTMKAAYNALTTSVAYADNAHALLQGKPANPSMVFNPVRYQPENARFIEAGLKNMTALVKGPAEVRDPVTGQTVTLNVPAFYNNPPTSLSVLMANRFDGESEQRSLVNEKGETLKFRNYDSGRSIGWDNTAWSKYVPSAEGKGPGYMLEAKRVIHYSFGTSFVFAAPDLFIR